MKTAIFAAALALAVAAPTLTAPPVHAASASVTIRTDDDRVYRERHDRGWHRGWYKDRRWKKNRRVVRNCEVHTERYWRRGRLIVERTRTCY